MKSWVEVSGERLRGNFRAVQAVVGADVNVIAVVKADAYGHGAAMCAPLLREAGARWLGVTDVEEGAVVRAALGERETEVLVMCGIDAWEAGAVVRGRMCPVVWRARQMEALEAAGAAAGRVVDVTLEIDTGMTRQGVELGAALKAAVRMLAGSRWLRCVGVMTHLCCSEVVGARATAVSQERFTEALRVLWAAGLRPEWVHVANTSAVDEGGVASWVRAEAAAMGARVAVRVGLGTYGYTLPLEGAERQGSVAAEVLPVMRWTTRVVDVREVAAGAAVGYGATFVAERPMRLALLPVGYADGFRREASSGVGDGWVMVAGRRARVVGRVSMNLTVVDVTGLADVEAGAEVVLLGEGVTADDHARWAGTIAYEILCGVRGRRRLLQG